MLGMLEIKRQSLRLSCLPANSVDQRKFDQHLSGIFLNRSMLHLKSKNSPCSLADSCAGPEEELAKVASPDFKNLHVCLVYLRVTTSLANN